MYDAKKHVQKEWQVIACGVLTVGAIGVGFSTPVKPGEIPITRTLAFATSGGAFVAGVAIDKSKELFDLQKQVIDRQTRQVFAASQKVQTAILLEDEYIRGEKIITEKAGGSDA